MPRETWSSRSGFVLATIGAAVGLGNIWRFSYVAGENGGATFLIVYLLFCLLLGAPLLVAEVALGRRGETDAIAAFGAARPGTRWRAAGGLCVAAAFLVMTFYAVIAGWVLKYLAGALSGALWRAAADDPGGYFRAFIADAAEPVLWQAVMICATAVVVAGGVRGGIERLNRVLMPALAALLVGLAGFALTLDKGGPGIAFLLAPDWSQLAGKEIYLAAMGQAFFSLGIGMAIFITYGSYLPRAHGMPALVGATVLGDILMALLAGLAIFPTVFAFGLDPAAGPELVFIALPQIFLAMPGGRLVGTLFFALLAAAALTSMVSLFEVKVAYAMRRLALSRTNATALVGGGIFLFGLPSALGFGLLSDVTWHGRGILDTVDHIVSHYALPAGGILLSLFVGWRWARTEALAESDLGTGRIGRAWLWILRVVAPLLMLSVPLRALFG